MERQVNILGNSHTFLCDKLHHLMGTLLVWFSQIGINPHTHISFNPVHGIKMAHVVDAGNWTGMIRSISWPLPKRVLMGGGWKSPKQLLSCEKTMKEKQHMTTTIYASATTITTPKHSATQHCDDHNDGSCHLRGYFVRLFLLVVVGLLPSSFSILAQNNHLAD